MNQATYQIKSNETVSFNNNALYCIGTGRMGLALQQEYMDHLRDVQSNIGFSHIRGHGLFCDDMAIYDEFTAPDGERRITYNFTYLDRVYDAYLKLGLKPFIELGFMPYQLASGTQTIFYWKGNTTPPADHNAWADLIRAYLTHLIKRYGKDEVASWPCEVWNQPNLPGFWKDADLDAYLKLYEASVKAVKSVLPEMRVGGPAVCGGDSCMKWISTFLTFCQENDLPVDFVTRHIYMAQTPEKIGKYTYHAMCTPDFSLNEAKETRKLIDSFDRYRGIDLHITEFNTSYNPRCPTHDTIYNAALICGLLAGFGDYCASYSYWTFSDVFEETGVYDSLFHGGFGLIADGNIPKPTYWAYRFFADLYAHCVLREKDAILTADGECYKGILWNCQASEGEKTDKQITIRLPLKKGSYTLITKTVDAAHGNPLQLWHEMGSPAFPSAYEKDILKQAAVPFTSARKISITEENSEFSLTLSPNAVTHVYLFPSVQENSFGYRYPAAENE